MCKPSSKVFSHLPFSLSLIVVFIFHYFILIKVHEVSLCVLCLTIKALFKQILYFFNYPKGNAFSVLSSVSYSFLFSS